MLNSKAYTHSGEPLQKGGVHSGMHVRVWSSGAVEFDSPQSMFSLDCPEPAWHWTGYAPILYASEMYSTTSAIPRGPATRLHLQDQQV
jgi:hypothetical protein